MESFSKTYVDCKIEEIERAWVGLSALLVLNLTANLCNRVLQVACSQLAHQQIDEVEDDGTSDLLGHIKEPDLPLAFGRLAESLEDQGKQSQDTERALHK